jgi:hypothetical protein
VSTGRACVTGVARRSTVLRAVRARQIAHLAGAVSRLPPFLFFVFVEGRGVREVARDVEYRQADRRRPVRERRVTGLSRG